MWWISARSCTLPRCSAVRGRPGLVEPDTELKFLGFGTMNGKDGRPFKTREGGVMRLETPDYQMNGREDVPRRSWRTTSMSDG